MATYKEVNGTAVTNNAGAFPGAADGELWFNSTASTFQYQYGIIAGVWSTGGNMDTGRKTLGGVGTQTAALAFGGKISPGPESALTETYNGSSWAEVNDLNNARNYLAGCGVQTSALAFGGRNPAITDIGEKTESWNGTNWTNVNDLNTARRLLAGSGLLTRQV